MLTLEGLHIALGAFQLRANFTVPVGTTAIIGASGGGKSTLLAAIAGFQSVAAGRVVWQGQDLTQTAPGKRPVSTLFQDNNLFPHMTVAQNVGLGLRPNLKLTKADQKAVSDALDAVGLTGMESRKPGALSGGQQSRAALARVLVADRPVVLLDEPFAALGPGLRTEMLQLVQDQLQGRTVLMVTHEPNDARHVADQVIVVSDGVAAEPIATGQLFENPTPALRAYLGQ